VVSNVPDSVSIPHKDRIIFGTRIEATPLMVKKTAYAIKMHLVLMAWNKRIGFPPAPGTSG
jgi:hypothetical protein